MSGLVSYQFAGVNEDLAPAAAILAERETPFLSKVLNQSKAVSNTIHYWVNRRLVGTEDVLYADVADGSSNVTVRVNGANTSGVKTKYVVGTIIEIGSEQLKVLSVDEVTNVGVSVDLTCSRSYAGSTHAAHTALDTVYIVGKPKQDGFIPSENEAEVGQRDSNVTQNLHRLVEISYTARDVKQIAAEGDVKDQTKNKINECLKELEIASLYSMLVDAGDGSARTMKGAKQFIPSGNKTDKTGNALTTGDLDTALFALYALGANPDLIVVGNDQKRKLNQLQASRFDKAQGQDTKKIQNILDVYSGQKRDIPIVMSQNVRAGDVFIFSTEHITVAPLQGQALQMEPLAKVGTLERAQVFGQYTSEFKLPETHWYFSNCG